MEVRFLIGPAGYGKTYRCLGEARRMLEGAPDGPPLILLVPKQATFQIERQLLTELPGYTRLHVVSFERLALFVLKQLGLPVPALLSAEGRVMVLRALLAIRAPELKLFRGSARQPGFAQQLSETLAEIRQHHFEPATIESLADRPNLPDTLRQKLADLGLLARAYADWLASEQLLDADCLLDLATHALRAAPASAPPALRIGALWLDGFAEMTPQELDFLFQVVAGCEQTTLALCADEMPALVAGHPGNQPLAPVQKTLLRCWELAGNLSGVKRTVERLPRDPAHSRFGRNPAFRHLEAHWDLPAVFAGAGVASDHDAAPPALRLVQCSDIEAEAIFAAREIRRYVRRGGRFREAAVLLRKLDDYHEPLRRAFRRYDIPFHLDRREPVAHHALPELLRYAARLAAFSWRHSDWFGALKTGFCPARDDEIDQLENVALARGWQGDIWLQPLPSGTDGLLERMERLRNRLIDPFSAFARAIGTETVTGAQLAEAYAGLMDQLGVLERLARWDADRFQRPDQRWNIAYHTSVGEQVRLWLESMRLAFSRTALPLHEWLGIIEAGLGALTVGTVPPALDQVLVGAIDRSRNPELKFAVLAGWNELVFPAVPTERTLFTPWERDQIRLAAAPLGASLAEQIEREWFFGYIACTRAQEAMIVTWALRDAAGRLLNESRLVDRLRAIFPAIPTEQFSPGQMGADIVHPREIVSAALAGGAAHPSLLEEAGRVLAPDTTEAARALAGQLSVLSAFAVEARLTPEEARGLYGRRLRVSITALEHFAACPFKFFVRTGLRARERDESVLDPRKSGTFQHEILARFDAEIRKSGRRWRDLPVAEARALLAAVAREQAASCEHGLFARDAAARFTADEMVGRLQELVGAMYDWFASNAFDPAAAELAFGDQDELAAWEFAAGADVKVAFTGKIDRIDLLERPGAPPLCLAIDYKSRARLLDPVLLEHGIQMQLAAYLAAFQALVRARPFRGAAEVVPAGMFYLNLRGDEPAQANRDLALAEPEAARRTAFRHRGRFSLEALPFLDSSGTATPGGSGQFQYRLTARGKPDKRGELLETSEFQQLIAQIPTRLALMAERIYAGDIAVAPFRRSAKTACATCDYQAICRVDRWSNPYRWLDSAARTRK